MVSRRLLDEMTQDMYRFNNAAEYIKMIRREFWRRVESLDSVDNFIPDFEE